MADKQLYELIEASSPDTTWLVGVQKADGSVEVNKMVISTFIAMFIDSSPTNGSTNAVSSDGVFDALALKANLASPALTGTPTAPTAALGTDTTQIATTAFVRDEIDDAVTNFNSSYFIGDGSVGNPITPVDTSGVPVQTIDCTSDASVEINLSSYTAAQRIRLEIDGLKPLTGASVRFQVSRTTSSAWDTTAGYSLSYHDQGGNAVAADSDYGVLHISNAGRLFADIIIPTPRASGEKQVIYCRIWGYDGGGSASFVIQSAVTVKSAGVINYIKFFDQYANAFSAGEIRVYVE